VCRQWLPKNMPNMYIYILYRDTHCISVNIFYVLTSNIQVHGRCAGGSYGTNLEGRQVQARMSWAFQIGQKPRVGNLFSHNFARYGVFFHGIFRAPGWWYPYSHKLPILLGVLMRVAWMAGIGLPSSGRFL
jgi:hypothetical protein